MSEVSRAFGVESIENISIRRDYPGGRGYGNPELFVGVGRAVHLADELEDDVISLDEPERAVKIPRRDIRRHRHKLDERGPHFGGPLPDLGHESLPHPRSPALLGDGEHRDFGDCVAVCEIRLDPKTHNPDDPRAFAILRHENPGIARAEKLHHPRPHVLQSGMLVPGHIGKLACEGVDTFRVAIGSLPDVHGFIVRGVLFGTCV